MVTFMLDRHSKMPLYEQLYRFLKKEIENNRLHANQKMPSKRKLAIHLKISQVTVETAYAQLIAEGYLRSVPKSGYFVEPFESGLIKPVDRIPAVSPKKQTIKQNYLYDFRTNAVDTNLFPFSTWARLGREVLRQSDNEMLNYTHPQGVYALRQEIVRYLYDYRGIKATADQVVMSAGSEYLMGLIIQLLGRNNIFGVENPGYKKICRIFELNQVKVAPLPLDKHGIDIVSLKKSNANVVHVTPSHQFPLGIVMPVSRRTALLNWAHENDKNYILEDDYDSEFRFSGQPIPALQGLDRSGKVIYINAFTKSLAPSLRINYMVLPPALLEVYRKKFKSYSCTVSNFEQYTLGKFMNGGFFERHLNRMRNSYKQRRDILIDKLLQSRFGDKIEVSGQDAGLHLLLNVNNGMNEQQLVQSAKKQGVRVYGLSEYCSFESESIPQSTLVIGYSSIPCTEIEQAVMLLEKAWMP
ncbi:MAG: PLP-dependent aminotransferase family protein [Oscillospiraceae bacterium]|nr:PLP-dependent aminotransferase family protein [Oscillospiraceae bacterium]